MKRPTIPLLGALCYVALAACGDPSSAVEGDVAITVDSASVRHGSDWVGGSVHFAITNVGEATVEFDPCRVNVVQRDIEGDWKGVGSFPLCTLGGSYTVEIPPDSTYERAASVLCRPETFCENWTAPFTGRYRLVLSVAPLPYSATTSAPFDVDVTAVP